MSYSIYHSVTGNCFLSLFTVSEWILEGAVKIASDKPIVSTTTVVLSFSNGSLHGFPFKEKLGLCYWFLTVMFGFFP